MIDINELRRKLRSDDPIDHIDIHANVKSALAELMNRLEAAEKERDNANAAAVGVALQAETLQAERDALRARIAEMEKQEPFDADHPEFRRAFDAALKTGNWPTERKNFGYRSPMSQMAWQVAFCTVNNLKLYAIPGAQPAPSVPEGWLRAIDEALIVTDLGVANAEDTYEPAREKLNNLIDWHVDVATDPAVNGGWKLAPIVSTHEMDMAGSDHCDGYLSTAQAVWDAMLAEAPERNT